MAEKDIKNYIESVTTYNDWEGMPVKHNDSDEAERPNYFKLLLAQREAERRFKLVSYANEISDEKRKKVIAAIATGVCFSALMASVLFSGNDIDKMAELGLKVFNNVELLPEYLKSFSPGMWLSTIGTATSLVKYIKHSEKEKNAESNYNNMLTNQPKYYMGEVEHQAKKL